MQNNDHQILASVIVPVWNGRHYILNILKDLQNQRDSSRVEYLIIDNDSTDGTRDLIRNFIQEHTESTRFTLLIETRPGVSNARNLGIKTSRGKYLIFVDADDRLKDTFVSSYINTIERDHADIEFFPFLKAEMSSAGEKIVEIHNDINYAKISNTAFVSSEQLLELIFKFQLHGYPFAYISKKSLWKSISFPSQIDFTEDLFALSQLLIHNRVLAKINSKAYYFYIQRTNSAIHRAGWTEALEAEQVANDILLDTASVFQNERLTARARNLIYGQYYFHLSLSVETMDLKKFWHYRSLLFKDFFITSMPLKSRIIRSILLIFLIPKKIGIARIFFFLRNQKVVLGE